MTYTRANLHLVPVMTTLLFLSACASERSNAIMKNRVLAMSPGNTAARACANGYVFTCKTTQEHVQQCYCLDQTMLRDVIPPDPAR
jgi:hypothetical protein